LLVGAVLVLVGGIGMALVLTGVAEAGLHELTRDPRAFPAR
jgi:hypothetical protein